MDRLCLSQELLLIISESFPKRLAMRKESFAPSHIRESIQHGHGRAFESRRIDVIRILMPIR